VMDLLVVCWRMFHFHSVFYFLFNAPASTEIYTLSLHDALPIFDSVVFRKDELVSEALAIIGLEGNGCAAGQDDVGDVVRVIEAMPHLIHHRLTHFLDAALDDFRHVVHFSFEADFSRMDDAVEAPNL